MEITENQINETAAKYIEHIAEISKQKKPLVAIHCVTYNHGEYLRDALEGFAMQQTTFPFVAIVHDDASTDNTAEVLREYADKYPDIILPIFETENQHSKKTLGIIMKKARDVTGAKYLAMCEGDDYWTDQLKLQKQVDFLESHPNISYTCHRYKIQNKDNHQVTLEPNLFLDANPNKCGFEFDLQYVFKSDWVTKTLTSVFRIECFDYNELKDCYYYRDVHNVYQTLSRTNGYCFQFIGGVYRKQETGVWSQTDLLKRAYTEVKTWESISNKIPTKLNKWKYRTNYVIYVYKSIKAKRLFKISNLKEVKALFIAPFEFHKLKKEIKDKTELLRVAQLELNKIIAKNDSFVATG